MGKWSSIRNHPFWIKLFQWEYWPMTAFYWHFPICWPWLAIRAGHPCFFTAANPGIKAGGVGMESKFETLQMLPQQVRPQSVFVPAHTSRHALMQALDQAGLQFPLIAKPDIGFRGFLVKKIDDFEDLHAYLCRYSIDFIVQEFLDYPQEIGLLYYRLPGEQRGTITSLTLKEFLHVTGDGQLTVRELVLSYDRARLQLGRLEEQQPALLNSVPPAGERVALGIVGNHTKGTRFIDGTRLVDATLARAFDRLADQIPGFNYGRFDIKCDTLEDLKAGRNFKIMELNGALAEPTHIYDPEQNSYFNALRAIVRHWKIIFRISVRNHRLGTPYVPLMTFVQGCLALRRYQRSVKSQAAAAESSDATQAVKAITY